MDFSIFKSHCFKGPLISEQYVCHQKDEAVFLPVWLTFKYGLFSPIAMPTCQHILYNYDIDFYPSAHQPAIMTSNLEEFLDISCLS